MIFMHIPKTAGLTLRDIIRRQYPPDEIYLPHYPPEHRVNYVRYLRGEAPRPDPLPGGPNHRFLELLRALPAGRRDQLRVVMGHIWFGIHEPLRQPFTYMTVLRDPVDRILSLYHHRATRHDLGMTLEEFLRAGRDLQLDNNQVRHLAATPDADIRFEPATPEMYDRAIENLDRHFSVVGLTERFDLTLLAAAKAFGWSRLGYLSQNVSSGRPRKEQLSPELLKILDRHTEYDRALHRRATERFPAMLERLDIDPERDLARLRRRVGIYRRVRPPYLALRGIAARALGRRRAAAVRPAAEAEGRVDA
jgi:hypothetical protein